MQSTRKIILLVCSIGAVAISTLAPANAQYYPPPGYGYGDGDGYRYGYGYHRRTWNGCPPGWTVQGGNCASYKGAGGGGWNTWNGCPSAYAMQWMLRRLPPGCAEAWWP